MDPSILLLLSAAKDIRITLVVIVLVEFLICSMPYQLPPLCYPQILYYLNILYFFFFFIALVLLN